MPPFKDLTNQEFGRLVVICPIKERKNERFAWLCRCNCGNLVEIRSNSLHSGNTKSCGCLQREGVRLANTTHGEASNGNVTRPYSIWENIRQRCLNPNAPAYKHYGARGVTICNEWENYLAFKKWALSNGYEDNLTIDRINNNGNYEPDNCRWITQSENSKRPKTTLRHQ